MKYDIKDCPYPFENLMIFVTGDVRPCCWSGGLSENLNKSSIEEIWNGKKMEELRECIRNNKIHRICQNSVCKYRQGYET